MSKLTVSDVVDAVRTYGDMKFSCRICDVAIMGEPTSACKGCPFNPNEKKDQKEVVMFT